MKIVFIGGGNMANALIGGLLKQGFSNGDIAVVEPNDAARAKLGAAFSVACHASAASALPRSEPVEVVVLAVKPQVMRAVATDLAPLLTGQLIISIAAGTRMVDLARWLGHGGVPLTRIVRAMPNTPALVGLGIAGVTAHASVTAADRDAANHILAVVGETVWVADESLLDPVTAVSGSGPAYVFYFIEAMVRAGGELGLSEAAARQLAVQTFAGAAELARQSPETLATLRANVTSKGGTTEAALKSMDASGVGEAIAKAVHAASARGREMGDLMGKD